ncbi:MAG: hypothetical protein ACM3XR_10985 [Bacillota bacterium]
MKIIYVTAAISIITNCIFAVPAGASINMTPSILAAAIHLDNSDEVGNGFKYPGGSGSAPALNAAAASEKESAAEGGDVTGKGDAAGTPAVPEAAGAADAEDDESAWYSPDIPMKKEHQQLLWECCREKGLDYIDMLALISLESNFNEKCSNNRYKGYFQISTIHAATLSKALKTPNKPLDGAVNIKWGTTLFSWILADKRVAGLEGKAKLDAALSIYQRGAGGYDKYGLNKEYLKKFYEKREKIAAYFEK